VAVYETFVEFKYITIVKYLKKRYFYLTCQKKRLKFIIANARDAGIIGLQEPKKFR
jgi:hypothetical protein